jgi:hypothetical protein
VEAGGGVGPLDLVAPRRLADRVVPENLERVVLAAPDEAARLHPQRVEDRPPDEVFGLLAGEARDGRGEVDEALARVAEPLAGREVNLERRLAAGPPVGEAGGVREDVAGGDLTEARVVADVVVAGEVVRERRVEVELAGVDELQDGVGEDGLGERGGLEDGLVAHGLTRRGDAHAEPLVPGQFPAPHERDGEARHFRVGQQAREAALQPRRQLPPRDLLEQGRRGL